MALQVAGRSWGNAAPPPTAEGTPHTPARAFLPSLFRSPHLPPPASCITTPVGCSHQDLASHSAFRGMRTTTAALALEEMRRNPFQGAILRRTQPHGRKPGKAGGLWSSE